MNEQIALPVALMKMLKAEAKRRKTTVENLIFQMALDAANSPDKPVRTIHVHVTQAAK